MSEIPGEVRTALDGLRSLGGDALLKQMVSVFVDYSADRIRAMQAAVEAADFAAAAAAAHTLKGSARQLGLTGLADACVGVEAASRQGDQAAAERQAAAVHEEYTTAVKWLESATA